MAVLDGSRIQEAPLPGDHSRDGETRTIVLVGDETVADPDGSDPLGLDGGPASEHHQRPRVRFRQVSVRDEQGLLTATDADGVVVCAAVPDRWIATWMDQDTPLLIEPWAVGHRTANRLREALTADAPPRVMPAMPHRYLEESLAAGSLISGKRLGRLVFVRLGLDPMRLTCAGAITMGPDEPQGPDLLDVATSVVDLTVGWFERPVTDVYAQQRSGGSRGSLRHHLTITTRFTGGGTSIAEIDLAEDRHRTGLREILLQGTTGAATVPWDAHPTMLGSDGHVRALAEPDGQGVMRRMLADWLVDPAPDRSRIADLLAQVDLRDAIDRSLHDRQPAHLPIPPEAPKEHR